MSKEETSIINFEPRSLIAKTPDYRFSSSTPTFILCDECYWCATYFDMTRVPANNNCPQCNESNNDNKLTSFSVTPNESFIFDYNSKKGLENGFKLSKYS